jgi:hypothetical protein
MQPTKLALLALNTLFRGRYLGAELRKQSEQMRRNAAHELAALGASDYSAGAAEAPPGRILPGVRAELHELKFLEGMWWTAPSVRELFLAEDGRLVQPGRTAALVG